MTHENPDFARTYSAMADEELVALSRDSASLVGAAQEALQGELNRRGLKPDQALPKVVEALACPGCGRTASDPLTCGSCAATICRSCGTELQPQWDADEDDLEDEEQAKGQAAG